MSAPRLSELQRTWLEELGLDRHMLARLSAIPAAGSPVAEPAPRATQAMPARGDADSAPSKAATDSGGPAGAMKVVAQRAAKRQPQAAPAGPVQSPAQPAGSLPQNWDALAAHVASCKRCGLHEARGQVVFGAGAAQAPDWLVIGEAPGDHDDRAGQPFQGKAGALLRAMLAAAGLDAEASVYFTNLVKCRPLGNRPPSAQEIAACMPALSRQIALLRPARLLLLGRLAAQTLLGTRDELDVLRGRVHSYRSEAGQDIPSLVTYHPASLLLRPQHKLDAWRDLNLMRNLH